MIVNKDLVNDFKNHQKKIYEYLLFMEIPVTRIAKELKITRQTATKKFKSQTWTPDELLHMAKILNTKPTK